MTAHVLPNHLVLSIDIEKVLGDFVITCSGCMWMITFTCFGVQVETLLFEIISTIVNYITILYVCYILFYCPMRLWMLVIYVFLEVLESMPVHNCTCPVSRPRTRESSCIGRNQRELLNGEARCFSWWLGKGGRRRLCEECVQINTKFRGRESRNMWARCSAVRAMGHEQRR